MIQKEYPAATVGELARADVLMRHVRVTDGACARFQPQGGHSRLPVFPDAALKNVPAAEDPVTQYSQGGRVMNVETSSSKRILRVCWSSFAAEALEA